MRRLLGCGREVSYQHNPSITVALSRCCHSVIDHPAPAAAGRGKALVRCPPGGPRDDSRTLVEGPFHEARRTGVSHRVHSNARFFQKVYLELPAVAVGAQKKVAGLESRWGVGA